MIAQLDSTNTLHTRDHTTILASCLPYSNKCQKIEAVALISLKDCLNVDRAIDTVSCLVTMNVNPSQSNILRELDSDRPFCLVSFSYQLPVRMSYPIDIFMIPIDFQ